LRVALYTSLAAMVYYLPMDQVERKIILHAQELAGTLDVSDTEHLKALDALYTTAFPFFEQLESPQTPEDQREAARLSLIDIYDRLGKRLHQIVDETQGRIQVYSFSRSSDTHGEASRLISKLRDYRTPNSEFLYYIQRAYELLFNLAFGNAAGSSKNHLLVKTPVTVPVRNFAVHKIPRIDSEVHQGVMCVLLRGALLPSMILSKEIQEYSSDSFVAPFALFKIKRNEEKSRADMEYILDLDASYFDPQALDGKDWFFADPMNATGGSLVAIVNYLKALGIKPRSVACFNVIAALEGSLQVIRSIPEAKVFTLWMDPVLNEKGYIMPGLGDAGDRLNGKDEKDLPRNLIQLIADYGVNISNLYRSQVREIEKTVLSKSAQ